MPLCHNIPELGCLNVFICPETLGNTHCTFKPSLLHAAGGSVFCRLEVSSGSGMHVVPPGCCFWVEGALSAEDKFVSGMNVIEEFLCCLISFFSGWGEGEEKRGGGHILKALIHSPFCSGLMMKPRLAWGVMWLQLVWAWPITGLENARWL